MKGPPVIYLIFNRPEETARSFAAIRAARPDTLLVVADGPRAERTGEAELCARTRKVVDGVDWPCRVLCSFADTNMGCGPRVASGLDWAFSLIDAAIILEDDCVPDQSFFPFCAEVLDRYRADERVMMISGNNFQNGTSRTPDSYYFSGLPHCWGWATWRRAWRHYDYKMQGWVEKRRRGWLKDIAKNAILEEIWRDKFDDIISGRVNTWDHQWMYCLLSRKGLSAVPNVNLVTNIGFGEAATHTFTFDRRHVVPRRSLTFPLRHPAVVEVCAKADEFEKRHLYQLSKRAFHARLGRIIMTVRPTLIRLGLWAPLRALAAKLLG